MIQINNRTFDALMASYPRCPWVGRSGQRKRAIPPGAPVSAMVDYLQRIGHPDAHYYWCRDPKLPRHMHLTTMKFQPKNVTPPA